MLTSRSVRTGAVVAALASVLALVLSACTSSGSGTTGTSPGSTAAAGSTSAPGSTTSSSTATSSAPPKPTVPVHIRTLNSDGSTYGVGMPVIVYFSKRITSAKAFQAATTLTVNGKPAQGAWYFETSDANKGYPIEAHFRMQDYWPAHSSIHIGMPVKGLSAGGDMTFDDSLTLDFSIGKRNISTVDDSSHTITVTSDGTTFGTFPVSLGADNTPTRSGIKVIMEQLPTVCMHDIAGTYYECGIKWDQRLTYDGEYLHSAPWNVRNIGHTDTSNGCTNLLPADAIKLFHFLQVGDVVTYPNANGDAMQLGNGYGDWNVDWGVWQTGGLVSTTA